MSVSPSIVAQYGNLDTACFPRLLAFCYFCCSPLTLTAGSLGGNAIGDCGKEGVVALAEAFKLMPGLTSVK